MTTCAMVTITSTLRVGPLRRLVIWFWAVAMVACSFASNSLAAEDAVLKPATVRVALRVVDENSAKTEAHSVAAKSSCDCSTSYCNGVRLQDQIFVINTRNLCGCCD